MVGGHQRNGLGLEVAPAFKGTAVEQHLRKPRVVADGTDHSAAAGFSLALRHEIANLRGRADGAVFRHGLCDAGTLCLIGNLERGFAHAERIEQPLSFELEQRLARDDFDHAAEHVGGMAVIPARPRLLHQRKFCSSIDELGVSQIGVEEIGLRVELSHSVGAIETIREARRVAQQILDGDRPLERFERELRLAGLVDADFHVGKRRNVFCDGIVKPELAVLDQHHGDDRRDRLRHRVEAEDRIRRHRQFCRDVAHAKAFEIDRLAVSLDQENRAGNLSARDVVPDVIADARKSFGRKAARDVGRRFRFRGIAPGRRHGAERERQRRDN